MPPRTSHGTFYLYFSNKEDLLRALAVECAEAIEELATRVPAVTPDDAGREALHAYLGSFLDTYGHYGVVIRAWMENQVSDRKVDRLGVDAFTHIAEAFAVRLHEAGAPDDEATVASLMAMLERTSYAMTSRDLGVDRDHRRRHPDHGHPPRLLPAHDRCSWRRGESPRARTV